MVNCDKCNAKNAVHVVHCVTCGELLPHFSTSDKSRKSTIKHDTTSWCYSSHDLSKVIVKSIVGILLYALVIISVLVLWPNFTVNDIELRKANAALKRAKVASYSRSFELQSSEEELAAVIRLGMPSFFVQGASWGTIVPREVLVEFTGPQSFDVLVTYYAINGSIPFTIAYSIDLPVRGVAPYKLTMNATKLGLLPVPMALVSPLIASAKKALQQSKLSEVMARIKWGKIEDQKLTVYSRINR